MPVSPLVVCFRKAAGPGRQAPDQARWAKVCESKISVTPGTGWSKLMNGGNRTRSSSLNATSNGSLDAAKVRLASNGSVAST
jgi:hypothetical protein